jgi:hypothetical protein
MNPDDSLLLFYSPLICQYILFHILHEFAKELFKENPRRTSAMPKGQIGPL